MKEVKRKISKKLKNGIPLSIYPGHTLCLEVTDELLTVHTGLSLHYAMAEALKIPQDKVKKLEAGYSESEHIFRGRLTGRVYQTLPPLETSADIFLLGISFN